MMPIRRPSPKRQEQQNVWPYRPEDSNRRNPRSVRDRQPAAKHRADLQWRTDHCAPVRNRLPTLLPREAWRRWLGETPAGIDELLDLMRPYPAELMHAYPVAARVGNVRNNDPALLDPLVLAA